MPVQFPSSEHGIEHRIQVRSELAAFAERKIVNHAGHVEELDIEHRRAVFRVQIVNVLRIGRLIAGEGFQHLLGIAHRVGPGEGVQEIQAVAEAMLQADREAVIVVVACRVDPGNRAEAGIGHARLHAEAT